MKLTAKQFRQIANSIPDFYDRDYIDRYYIHIPIMPEIEIIPKNIVAPKPSKINDSELIFKRGRYDWEIEL